MNKAGTITVTFRLVGGRLSLDFANTVGLHASDHPVEHLTNYSDLVAWGHHVGILTDHEVQHLLKEAARRPVHAAEVLERAIALREAIYRIFSAISYGRPPQATDLATFNAELSRALAQSRIASTADGLAWDWAGAEDALDRMLWPVVHDAAGLLTSEHLDRVGVCADVDGCGWLFLDMSRNRSRRWCAMDDCGNRAKARRHYERKRAVKG